MREIDKLIKATEYNKALSLLSRYIEDNPDKFDLAQKRIDKIIKARANYNELAKLLMQTLQNEPENNVKIYEITSALESYEKNPTDSSLAFIHQARTASKFAYFKAKYDQIMAEGSELVRKGEYVKAVEKFYSGFSLYREDYDEKDYGKEITSPVSKAISGIASTNSQLSQVLNALEQNKKSFNDALKKNDTALLEKSINDTSSTLKKLVKLKDEILENGDTFTLIDQKLKAEDPELTDASHVAFLQHFTLGRITDPDAGIKSAYEAAFYATVENMKKAVSEIALSNFEKISGNKVITQNVRTSIENARKFGALALKINLLYKNLDPKAPECSNVNDSFEFLNVYLSLYEQAVSNRNDVESLVEQNENDSGNFETEQFISRIGEFEKLISKAAMISDNPSIIERLKAENYYSIYYIPETDENRKTAGLALDNTLYAFEPFITELRNLLSENQNIAALEAARTNIIVAKNYNGASYMIFEGYNDKFKKAKELYDGISDNSAISSVAGADFDIPLKKYPTESLSQIQSFLKTIDSDIAAISNFETKLSSSSKESLENEEFSMHLKGVTQSKQQLSALKNDSLNLSKLCQEEIQKAMKARNEAELRYNEALAALKKNNFDDVRSSLQRASQKYVESLSYQESQSLRNEADEKLAKIGNEVARKENEIVVRDVRTLKNQAKQAYFYGDFEGAENYLVQAKTRWSVTNVDDDIEILNLMALVSTALSMKTGREIPPASPLYPEMSQILSSARLNYEEGRSLMKKNKVEDAKKVLNLAKDQIHQVQLVFPLNKDASLLNLRIDQLIDPSNFKVMFDQRVSQAKINYKSPDTRQSAYLDLLDLYEINPDYPGLKQLIYDVEIAIGVRQKPVDNSAKTRSQNLAKEAQSIYSKAKGDEDKLKNAISKLDDAIKLNPDNDAAQKLKDKIQTEMGGQAVTGLSSSDEAVFQRAIVALQKNNIIVANALVEQLMQKKLNKRVQKVLDLQKKVKALL